MLGLYVLGKGLVVGFAVAAPVGPIGLLCIRRTLTGGASAGLASGIGAATGDALGPAWSLPIVNVWSSTICTCSRVMPVLLRLRLRPSMLSSSTRRVPGWVHSGVAPMLDGGCSPVISTSWHPCRWRYLVPLHPW